MEPFEESERREAAWDRDLSRLPKCARCGEPITDRKLVRLDFGEGGCLCLRCVERMVEFNEEAEIE